MNQLALLLAVAALIAIAATVGLVLAEVGSSAADQPRVQAVVEAEGGALVARFKVLQGRIGGLMLQVGGGEPKPADSCAPASGEYYQGQSGVCQWNLKLNPGAYDYVLYAYSADGRQVVVARGRVYVSP